jgi:hypothetical protein
MYPKIVEASSKSTGQNMTKDRLYKGQGILPSVLQNYKK